MTKAAYFRIGLFMITASLLAAAGVVVLGAGALKEKGIIVETYVDESVQGLAVGSPVKYRGVQVGRVEDIDFVYLTYAEGSGNEVYDKFGKWVIVRMSINPKAFSDKNGTNHDPKDVIDKQVTMGMRARIASQGITGVAYVEVDYLDPDPLKNPIFKPEWTPKNLYLPSAPSTAARLTNSAESVVNSFADAKVDVLAKDVDKLANSLTETIEKDVKPALAGINKALEELGPTFRNVGTASEDLGPTLANVRKVTEDLGPTAKDLKTTAEKLPGTVEKVDDIALKADEAITKITAKVETLSEKLEKLIDTIQAAVDRDLAPAVADVRTTAKDLPEAIASLQVTLKRVDRLVSGEEQDVNAVLSQLRTVAHDVEELSGYAKKYPAHILFGNPPPQRERK